MKPLFRLASHLPLWLLHLLGAGLGWAAFLVSATYRGRLRSNAAQAGHGWQVWGSAVAHAGRMVAELPRLWLGAPVPMRWEGAQHVTDALALGKGVIVITPHLGGFEVVAQAYAAQFGATHPMTALFRPPKQAWLAEVVRASRARPGLHTLPTDLSGVKGMLKALRRGETVGLLPDQVPPHGMGQWAPFFGKEAYTMTLANRLIAQTGAAPMAVWCERLPWGRGYVVRCGPFWGPDGAHPSANSPSGNSSEALNRLNAGVQRMIDQCPEQYLWGYARYKAPAQPAPVVQPVKPAA